jgi:hypothetical protein
LIRKEEIRGNTYLLVFFFPEERKGDLGVDVGWETISSLWELLRRSCDGLHENVSLDYRSRWEFSGDAV